MILHHTGPASRWRNPLRGAIMPPKPDLPQETPPMSEANAPTLSDETLTALRPLQRQFPTLDAALAEISRLSARPLSVGATAAPRRYPQKRAEENFPPDYRELFAELLREPTGERGPHYYDALIEPLVKHDRALHVLRLTVRVVRNLAVDELVIGGDLWDRGPPGHRLVDYLMRQPRPAVGWGNP